LIVDCLLNSGIMGDIEFVDGTFYEDGNEIRIHPDEEKKIDDFLKHMKRVSEEKVNSSPKKTHCIYYCIY